MTSRRWPSLEIRVSAADPSRRDACFECVASVLDDVQPSAVEEREAEWLASFASAEARDLALHALGRLGVPEISAIGVDLPDEDWAARSQAGLTPITVGRLVVTPPWFAASPEVVGRPVVVVIQPSMGFGTGHHATTRLCLQALQTVDLAGRRVLDVGTGSGVLALAASLLGARDVSAVDNDPDAIASARENLELNPAAGPIDLRVADLGGGGLAPADLVLANLTGASLVRLAGRLADATAPGGTLVASGFTSVERDEVAASFAPAFVQIAESAEQGWGCLVLGRRR